MNSQHVLDPLWIIKGSEDFDPEYYKYVMLAANKQWRDQLEEGSLSSFYEILFHSLNLNNLAVEGKILDFKMNPIWDEPKLKRIRKHLRKVYQLPDNIIEIFKNSNYVLSRLLVDYLDNMLEKYEEYNTYFVNKFIHNEKEIFIVSNVNKETNYSVFKLKFDRRFKYGHKLERIIEVELDGEEDNALYNELVKSKDSRVESIDPDKNVIFVVLNKDSDKTEASQITAFSLIFSKGIIGENIYQTNILLELYDLLSNEHVLPFTISSWK